jgi:flagellar hook assembly protein FlgD
LIHHNYPAGEHAVKWDGRDETGNIVNSGIYLINFKAGDFSASRKITFMK